MCVYVQFYTILSHEQICVTTVNKAENCSIATKALFHAASLCSNSSLTIPFPHVPLLPVCHHFCPLTTSNLFSILQFIHFENVIYNWDHIVCNLLILSFSTKNNDLKVHPVACINSFFLWLNSVYFVTWIYLSLFIYSLTE